LTGNEIREMFLKFFEEKGHRRVRSSSLVPTNDPTLLFTNAGMNQFKDVFLGVEKRDYKRATTCQKCVRAGGKHNDLENVGFTNRHHTFFEMLGNFSFGDYFKKDAIAYAWELVTSPNWFNISKEKLYVTVFGGAEVAPGQVLGSDRESVIFWNAYPELNGRVVEVPGLKENFWAMGDTGPCGPCTEIFYDMGPEASDQGHTDCNFPCDCGRYVEIWNLVFMQFNRDASGKLNLLPKPSVDTGAGLERVTAVLQGKISNFDTDLFQPLIKEAARLSNVDPTRAEIQPSLRIIADHSRAATFLISDGVIPSNEGRGYVLRKIIRRSLYHAQRLMAPTGFLSSMSDAVRAEMRDAYPELEAGAERVRRILDDEESRFVRTLNISVNKIYEYMGLKKKGDLTDERAATGKLALPGEIAFQLYDPYGAPRDFIADVARDYNFDVD
jgi:alanyl-tRNA synthetase